MQNNLEEADKEIDVGKAPPTRDLAPEHAPALLATLLAMDGIWMGGRGNQVAGPAISSRARGKAPAIQAE